MASFSSPYTINLNPDGTPQVEVPNSTISSNENKPMTSDELAMASLPINYDSIQKTLDLIGMNVNVNPGTQSIFSKLMTFIQDNPGLSMIIGVCVIVIASGQQGNNRGRY